MHPRILFPFLNIFSLLGMPSCHPTRTPGQILPILETQIQGHLVSMPFLPQLGR